MPLGLGVKDPLAAVVRLGIDFAGAVDGLTEPGVIVVLARGRLAMELRLASVDVDGMDLWPATPGAIFEMEAAGVCFVGLGCAAVDVGGAAILLPLPADGAVGRAMPPPTGSLLLSLGRAESRLAAAGVGVVVSSMGWMGRSFRVITCGLGSSRRGVSIHHGWSHAKTGRKGKARPGSWADQQVDNRKSLARSTSGPAPYKIFLSPPSRWGEDSKQ